jgi:hypothetical protein
MKENNVELLHTCQGYKIHALFTAAHYVHFL